MTTKIELCALCRFDGGWHYDEDGNATRPHHEQAAAAARSLAIVEAANEEQTKAMRDIVTYAAERMFEFSANNLRDEIAAAGVEGPVVGAAFKWAETQGLIEATGRSVPSNEASTRHRINLWRSVARAQALGVVGQAS